MRGDVSRLLTRSHQFSRCTSPFALCTGLASLIGSAFSVAAAILPLGLVAERNVCPCAAPARYAGAVGDEQLHPAAIGRIDGVA